MHLNLCLLNSNLCLKNWKNSFYNPYYFWPNFFPCRISFLLRFNHSSPPASQPNRHVPVHPPLSSSSSARAAAIAPSAAALCAIASHRLLPMSSRNKAPRMPPHFPSSNGIQLTLLPLLYGFETEELIFHRRRPTGVSSPHYHLLALYKVPMRTPSIHWFHFVPKLHLFMLYSCHNRAPTHRHFGPSSPTRLQCPAAS
jgi:hypothetical protein